jgi:hypothetical protein
MRCIIAGGRGFIPAKSDYNMVKHLLRQYKIDEIVCGNCSGADEFGKEMSYLLDLELKVFPTNWNEYFKIAGPIRNKEMARYTDYAILMRANKGTDSMRNEMNRLNKKIIYDAKDIF